MARKKSLAEPDDNDRAARSGNDLDIAIGQRVRTGRMKLELSQTALADKAGISYQQLQKYESGANALAPVRIVAICELLGTDPNGLLGWTGKTTTKTIPRTLELEAGEIKLALLIASLPAGFRRVIESMVTGISKLTNN